MSSRSLSLQAYRALARRGARSLPDLATPRPDGELVWFHLGSSEDAAAVIDLAQRFAQLRQGTHVLLTLPPEQAKFWTGATPPENLSFGITPDEHPNSIAAFLNHWAPDIALWVWGGLRPNLVDEAARRKTPLHLVAADSAGFDGRRDRWLPELAKNLLRSFETITARNKAAAQRLMRLGLDRDTIDIRPRLRASGHPLPYDQTDLAEMTAQLAGRPVWLAAQAQPEEWGKLLTAHRAALRNAHRLLLVIELAAEKDLGKLVNLLKEHNTSFGVWGDGTWPEDNTQVLIADIPDELGLWYRVATVSFLGGSLVPKYGGIDPLPAAALGTAILYGPHVRHHLPRFTRLTNAGAARIVNDGMSLAAAVTHLIAPDNAAKMAHAGWDVSSEGAEVVDNLIELVQDTLDQRARQK